MKILRGLILIFGLSVLVCAQRTTLNGVVYSETGSRIIGTKVNFVSSRGEKFTTGVNQDTVYQITLPPGTYEIDFIRTGFKPLTISKYSIVKTDSGIMYLDVVLERAK